MTNIKRFTTVILLACAFNSGHAQESGKKMNQKEIRLLLDSVSIALQRWYVYPDQAALMAQTLKTNFKKEAYSKVNSRLELSRQLTNEIRQVQMDKHLRIRYDPEFAETMSLTLSDSLAKQENELMLKEARERNFGFVKAEKLSGNIGYVRWDEFDGNDEAIPTFNAAFQFLANTKALIIDMRYNGGGWRNAVINMQNYFFDTRTPLNHVIDAHSDTLKCYSDPSKTDFKLKMPVYILTSKGTFSGAEDFTYGLKHAKRAIVVGDTSGGGAHPTDYFNLGQGFVANIPLARAYNEFTKTDWERTGVLPDVAINWEQAFSKAQMIIYKDLLMKTNDAGEKYLYQWNLDMLENKIALNRQILTDSVKYSKEQLQDLCGNYTPENPEVLPVTILIKGHHIYRHVNPASIRDERLTPIGNNRFVYDDESGRFMDFIIDKTGKVTGLSITRGDGITFHNKVK